MALRDVPDKFVVAFSLAGEQKARVRPVAEAVEAVLGPSTVFLDEWFEHHTGGADGDLRLQAIYSHCHLAIVCVSGRYGEKGWPLAEFAAIRVRVLKAREAADERERDRVFMLRFGEGEVEGILPIDIVPDVQQRSAADTAELILARLRKLDKSLVPDANPAPLPAGGWLTDPPEPDWPIADHIEARDAFATLLTRNSPYRYLAIRGEQGVGKTRVTQRMLTNALALSDVACGRFDFKGTTDMNLVLSAFVQELGVTTTLADTEPLHRRLAEVLDQLRKRARPTLVIFDGHSFAPPGVAQWLETQLLPSMIRAAWLRVVVASRDAPPAAGSKSERVLVLKRPTVTDWLEYGKRYDPTLELMLVQQLCLRFEHDAALLERFLSWRPS